MAAVTIHNDFWAHENKIWHWFHIFSIYLPWNDGVGYHDLSIFFLINIKFQASFFTLLFHPQQEAI